MNRTKRGFNLLGNIGPVEIEKPRQYDTGEREPKGHRGKRMHRHRDGAMKLFGHFFHGFVFRANFNRLAKKSTELQWRDGKKTDDQ